jgi:glutaredoxin-like protein NrdH
VTIFLVVLLIMLAGLAGWLLRRRSGRLSPAALRRDSADKTDPLYSLGLRPGEDGKPFMYALETCRHCRAAREFLEENDLDCHILYVDHYTGEDRARLMEQVRARNPRGSFPTFVFPEGQTVVGFREQLLREALLHENA